MVFSRRTFLSVSALVLASGRPAAAAPARCGDHPWCAPGLPPDERASLLLRELTLPEKISLLGGDDLVGPAGMPGGHTGTGNGVERLDVPPVHYGDGPIGARQGNGTAMPATIALAAGFDRDLASRYGAAVANEIKLKGNDVVFGPTADIVRTPLSGRTFEGFGEDPHLTSRLAVSWIGGAHREGLIVCVKHFAAYNQEGVLGAVGSRMTYDAIVDERTLREIHLPPFEAAVREAGVGAVMGSYNRLNGQYACENQWLLNDLLKGEWGFAGYTIADYGATRNTGNSLSNGLDFEPWPALVYSPPAISAALAAGRASTADVDDHAHRILRTMFAHGLFDRPPFPPDDSSIDREAHLELAGEVAEHGTTLLVNDGVLPLDENALRGGRIAVIGEAANRFVQGGGSSSVTPFEVVTPRQGIERRAGAEITVSYHPGGDPRAAAAAARDADVAIIFAADLQSEFVDKPGLDVDAGLVSFPPPAAGNPLVDQDAVVEAVVAANPNAVVVLETGGPVLTPWRHRVRALLEAWYPGANAGTALARVLFGDVDPGGRLPVTFPARESDLPTAGDPKRYPGIAERVHYSEGVFVGYRHYDGAGIEPAFPFGHGLSYTEFEYADLRVDGMTATASVTNAGDRRGFAVPQLYLGLPSPSAEVRQPPKQLKGFRKIALEPGETAEVTFELTERDLSYWDETSKSWRIAPGRVAVLVGESSRDIRLTAELPV
ncbi:glycoside hydrolase family 3 C-terminal domain-containing protein [Saccharopolyspora sp. WRP15-2]|uniref:Glycoside hydrolase family 3 C-terminal domain-containing protein n=1 Tax=Saccharopolyspora oryzae TaxID=2997343 RepID=A0ABT4V9S1_9PSEU|nr:glycoside hydrolase family 3 C-terminal domain-containing protein [Saccharopolyspora oryzae]MDA3630719.1 glycoside hydrolase family 3 C-terminal domain-containing protein [Saccharopolyspora oryzae]